MTKKEAILIILSDKKAYTTSLNYAIAYCEQAMNQDEESYKFDVQVMYILTNITHWRHPQAKEIRATLRAK